MIYLWQEESRNQQVVPLDVEHHDEYPRDIGPRIAYTVSYKFLIPVSPLSGREGNVSP